MRDWREEVRLRLANSRLAPTREAEIVEELAQHLNDRYDTLRDRGMSDVDATRAVLDELANAEGLSRELDVIGPRTGEPLDVGKSGGIGSLMTDLYRDVRHALRGMRRSPSFTLVAVLCLALGIGATSTIFGIVDSLFFRPPAGVGHPGEIVRPYFTRTQGNIRSGPNGYPRTSYPEYLDLRDGNRTLSGIASFMDVALSVGEGTSTEHADGLLVTGNYFSVLQTQPALGRFFVAEEDKGPGSPAAVVISHEFWRRQFGGDSSAIGRNLRIDGHPYEIVGVTSTGFHGLDAGAVDVWIPMSQVGRVGVGDYFLTNRYAMMTQTVGRLKPGMTRELAQGDLQGIIRHVASQQDTTHGMMMDPDPKLTLAPILAARGPTPSEQAQIARWLALAAILVLAIACANIANLLLTRAATRRKETAIRLSMGASRWRLVRALLTESVLLAGFGAVGGLMVAFWGTRLVPTVGLPPLRFFAQGRVLVFAIGAALVCGVLFGIVPALSASRTELSEAMREGTRAGSDHRSRTRSALMVIQVALAVLLLTGAGLFVHSLRNVQSIDLGIDAAHLAHVDVDLASIGIPDSAMPAFYDRALERVKGVPGVAGAVLVSIPQMNGSLYDVGYTISGQSASSDNAKANAKTEADQLTADYYAVGDGYFGTVGTPIKQGRDFTTADRKGSQPVMIVNEALVTRDIPDGKAIGKCLTIRNICYTIVGIAATSKYGSITEKPTPAAFMPISQWWEGYRTMLIRFSGNPAAVVPSVRHTLLSMQSNLPYPEIKTFDDMLRPQLQPRRLGAAMFSVFGLLALVLAAVGLYGVVSYAVAQRTHEVGIRMALGARSEHVVRLVVRQGALLTLLGLVLGIAGALGATHLITHLLFGVSAADPVTFAGVCLILAAVAALASYLPARRATRVDPMIALRAE